MSDSPNKRQSGAYGRGVETQVRHMRVIRVEGGRRGQDEEGRKTDRKNGGKTTIQLVTKLIILIFRYLDTI